MVEGWRGGERGSFDQLTCNRYPWSKVRDLCVELHVGDMKRGWEGGKSLLHFSTCGLCQDYSFFISEHLIENLTKLSQTEIHNSTSRYKRKDICIARLSMIVATIIITCTKHKENKTCFPIAIHTSTRQSLAIQSIIKHTLEESLGSLARVYKDLMLPSTSCPIPLFLS